MVGVWLMEPLFHLQKGSQVFLILLDISDSLTVIIHVEHFGMDQAILTVKVTTLSTYRYDSVLFTQISHK